MSKRFYVATRKDRVADAAAISEALKQDGWERTFAWTSEEPSGHEQYAALAQKELDGVVGADLLIVLLPGGYGTHVEIGAALAVRG
jgi:hypothetical protein